MKPIKALMALIAALVILPSCTEEEWENLTYEEKYIETLLYQQKPRHDIGDELVDSMRYVVLKTGIELTSPYEKAWSDTKSILGPFYTESIQLPSDTIGIVKSVKTLRKELELSGSNTLTYKGFEVLGIEDVTVDGGPILHHIEMIVDLRELPDVEDYIRSLGCRPVLLIHLDYPNAMMRVDLPLERKAIPTRDEILNSKLYSKLCIQDVNIRPIYSGCVPLSI